MWLRRIKCQTSAINGHFKITYLELLTLVQPMMAYSHVVTTVLLVLHKKWLKSSPLYATVNCYYVCSNHCKNLSQKIVPLSCPLLCTIEQFSE